ncbi:MAG: helix-turn-helix domain-containing protein [Candidatus Kariarchaeaceae archaeon]
MGVEIHLKVRNDCEFSELSDILGKKQFFTFCNNYYDLIMMDGEISNEDANIVKNKLGLKSEVSYTSNKDSAINYLIMDCSCENSYPVVQDIILKNYGIPISPVRYDKGWEFHRFVCIDKKSISNVLANLKEEYEIDIISIKDDDFYGPLGSHGLAVNQFLNSLTKSQLSLLINAHAEGYYKIPRKIKLLDIASELGISRYAVESRLRRGENAIMDLLLPILDFEKN